MGGILEKLSTALSSSLRFWGFEDAGREPFEQRAPASLSYGPLSAYPLQFFPFLPFPS